MERELRVAADMEGQAVEVGRLWARVRAGKESASFEYEPRWLAHPRAFSLDPELPLGPGLFHTSRPLFNAFSDPAPDRWGQTLMRRAERAGARREGRTPRTFFAVDFLVRVDDETRLGALRFREGAEGPFLSEGPTRVPPLVDLPKLLSATARIVDDRETDADLLLLLAPGTSLGGARPKASVRGRDGRLLIAKFPRKDDDWPVTRWEAVALSLAERAGIQVPSWRLELVAKRPVLLLRRFDRRKHARVAFQSALTAVGADDAEAHSYLEIVDALRRGGSEVDADARQLWRRVVFNVLVSNTDDHLRNHGFLRDDAGWRLAPAYDMNPVPVDVRPRVHALAVDETETEASMETVMSTAPSFGIARAADARAVAREVGKAVAGWRDVAKKHSLRAREIERMESAFEHQDARAVAKGAR